MTEKKNYTVPIVMMVLLFGMISFVTNLAAPMGIVLKSQFGVSNFQGLLGNMGNFIAYAVMGIPSGILLQRIGYKKTALIAIAVGILGIFIQFLSGHSDQSIAFWVYLSGAFVAGFSMCLLNTVVNPMLNTLGGGGNKGNQLIQVGGSFNSVMATLTPMLVGMLIGDAAKAQITNIFPFMYAAMAVFALVFIVLFLVKIPEPNAETLAEPLGNLMRGALKFRHFILGAIGIFVYVGVEVGTPGIANLYMTTPTIDQAKGIVGEYQGQQNDAAFLQNLNDLEKQKREDSFNNAQKIIAGKSTPGLGIAAGVAGGVVGFYWFLMLIGRLVGASIGGKVSSKKMLGVTSAVGILLILLAIFLPVSSEIKMPSFTSSGFGMTLVPTKFMFIVLVGLCTSIMWGGIFNLAVEGLGKYLAAASGIFMVLVCGGGILPAIQGWVADIANFNVSYWVIIAGLAYLLFYALIGSKNVNKDIPV